MPKQQLDEEYLRDEYSISSLAMICHSTDHGYYFSDYQFSQACHSISHMICLVQKSSVARLYNSPEVSTRLGIIKVNSIWNEPYNIGKMEKFGNDFQFKKIRYQYAYSTPFVEAHPSTNNGTRKVIDFYCLKDSFKFIIDLNQENIFYSSLNVEKIPKLLRSEIFSNWNSVIPQHIFLHKPNENEFNKMCMIVHNEQDTVLKPLIIRDEGSLDELRKYDVRIQPLPLDSNNYPLYWSFLTRLDCIDENYLTYSYQDEKNKKICHIIRKISIQYDEDTKLYSGKLSKSPLLDFFKFFTDNSNISGSCRLTDSCFLFMLCKNGPYWHSVKYKDWGTFTQNVKWILVDLKNSTIKNIEPYSGNLKSSQPITKVGTLVDDDGFETTIKKKHITLRKSSTEVRTEGADFLHVDLVAYQPFKGYPELVNVICTIPACETRTAHSQPRKESLHTVIQVHYCFKIHDEFRQLFKETPKSYSDIYLRFC
ncbi:predicted protein [Naegleria gruberi]|uniref:Predicted protein n=1 Tax=Naegleria gruberi TaxID=5762 RepID=D2VBJ1_NAEGR|nr:uncharacterized protein NAEGRDRAFT_66235 [Naegleria gruberi]EFC45807.1 predicted protein [Naegleria gruberi]|eukprot:XP_002678551.1 predicted protein [Naegleria gruberi strain NEG-M]